MTRRAEITVTINDQTVMSWFSLIVKDVARGVEPHVMWWLLEGIEPSSDSRLSPVARLGGAAVERNGRKNDHLEPRLVRDTRRCEAEFPVPISDAG